MKEARARATDRRLRVKWARRRLYVGRTARAGARTSLTLSDWRLLIVVAVAQVVAAGALRVMSLRAVHRRLAQFRPLVRLAVRASDERAAWATHATGRRLGRCSTCLTRALAAALVIEHATGLTFNIGVRRKTAGTLDAHAWLARGDRVLIGATPDDYAPLVEWAGRST